MTALITFAERFAGRWSSDPSVIARFSKQLPDGHIDQGAIILEHTRLLRALVRQELGMPLPPGPPPPQRPGSRQKPRRHKPRAQYYPKFRKHLMKRAVQQRPNVIKVDDAIKTTISEIMAEARNGKWRVYGYDEQAKKKVTLSEADLTGQPSLAGVAAHRIGRYKDVRFERIVEPSEEAPAAVAEQAAAIQDARKLVHEWYVDGWVPACDEAGFIPSRDDDDPKAAKRVFGDKIDGLRDILRDAREEHAPKPWRRRGPKGLDRKNAHSDPDYPKRLDRVVKRSIELLRGS